MFCAVDDKVLFKTLTSLQESKKGSKITIHLDEERMGQNLTPLYMLIYYLEDL